MDRFIELVAEIFDIDSSKISLDKDFRTDLDEYNSMIGFALLVMMEDEYGIKISPEEFLTYTTLADLYNRCINNE